MAESDEVGQDLLGMCFASLSIAFSISNSFLLQIHFEFHFLCNFNFGILIHFQIQF